MTVAAAPYAVDDAADVRDAAAIDPRDWPDRPLTVPTADGRADHFQVVYRQSALDAIHLHGQTRTDVEVCGVLIGTGCRDAHGPYLLVEHAIAGSHASSRQTNVTFTADTWQHIQTIMDRDHADKKMVGWYHTHPGFGIFLSGMDTFICDNFFNLPWQVAFVYDPVGGDEGNFVWRGGVTTREPVLLEDDVTPAAAAVPLMPVGEAMTGSDPAGEWAPSDALSAVLSAADTGPANLPPEAAAALQSQVIELMTRVRRLERRQKVLFVAVLFVVAFVAMWATQLGPATAPPRGSPSTPTPQADTSTPTSMGTAVPSAGPAVTTPPRAASAPAHVPEQGH